MRSLKIKEPLKIIEEVMTKKTQSKMTPNSVILDLMEGNKRYVEGAMLTRDLTAQRIKTIRGQFPKAIVLSCIDSRVPVEFIFDQGIGDLLVIRIAGNFENPDILGSMEYACKILSSKVIMVLGHQYCEAIRAACEGVNMGNITNVLSKLEPAIIHTDKQQAKNLITRTRPEFIQKAIENNVRLTMRRIRRDSPILNELEKSNKIKIIGGVYYLDSGKIVIF